MPLCCLVSRLVGAVDIFVGLLFVRGKYSIRVSVVTRL